MIVKDEERFLPGCLESVKELVDEIVIADTGSTDNTKEIARGFGARIVDFPWRNDFAAARNESLEHTTGEWVLYLDADERIDGRYHDDIRKAIASGKGDAFLLTLRSRMGVKENSQYHLVAYPRLFRKMKGVRFTGEVHEQITPSLNEAGARIVPSDVIIDHLGYAQEDDVIIEKAKRNKTLLLSQLGKNHERGYTLYQLGQTEIVLGETEAGLAHLNEALAAGEIGDSVVSSIYGIIAENKLKKKDYPAAVAACDRSLQTAPRQAFAHILKGDALTGLERHGEALEEFSAALKQYETGLTKGKVDSAVEPVFDVFLLYVRLGDAAVRTGDRKTAATYLGKAAARRRTPERIVKYFDYLIRQGMSDELEAGRKEFAEFSNEDWYLRIIASTFMDRDDFGGAARLLEKISEHDAISLSSLANCRMKSGDFVGSESAFLKAIELGYKDPQGLEMLGLVQFKLLKFADAAATLSKVVEADPSNERAAKFMLAARAQAGLNQVSR